MIDVDEIAYKLEGIDGREEVERNDDVMIVQRAIATLETKDRELIEMDGRWRESDTARVLRYVVRSLPKFSDALAASYFAHSSISRTGRVS